MAISTSNASSKSLIPLLTNYNYSVWNCKMEALLMRANLFTVVNGTEIDPDATNHAFKLHGKLKMRKHNVSSY
jgi:hypothetical protein